MTTKKQKDLDTLQILLREQVKRKEREKYEKFNRRGQSETINKTVSNKGPKENY